MVSRVYVGCLAAVLALLSRLSEAVGPVVRCEPCDAQTLGQCKPPPTDCVEKVREPGCGCCMTCALTEGQNCGVYTERCGSGLTCQPQPGESKPLQAMLEGRGVCSSSPSSKLRTILPRNGSGNASGSEEERNSSSTDIQDHSTVKDPKSTHRSLSGIIRKDHTKKQRSYKVDYVPTRICTDSNNFVSESKQETEYGPCRREMESILNNLKIMNVLSPRGFRIPNCDKKGFYKKKQCRPSKGRKRGYCWCVDKYGQPLQGYDGKGKGEAHCYNLENK
ncbi:insulin-like growth factor-binding protein 3 [Erpetoichthys calabaricus]|uniref:Insulin-like growth factor-binding protein 3 n=1 Tax=Erpetoichthys calabaricus TaxID=27687 RepID=A0A8C4RN82_ERPCA|nr:insulin-like growth factor-binding protein 3 [Erpetoichthys calabaricus]